MTLCCCCWVFFSFSFLDWLALSILVWPPGVYQPAAVAVMFACHHTWPGSAMCLVLDQTWLTDCCSCCLFPLTALSTPSTQLFCPPRSIPKLCQRMLHSTPPSVIGLLCWEPPDLIRKGIWTPLVLSCPHLSSGLLRSPSFPLTSPSLPLLTALILSSRLPSLAPRWLLSSGAKWLPCRFLRCRHFLALPFPSNVNPFLCDSCFFFFLQGSAKKAPPAAQLMRVKQPGSHSAVKREKRLSTSSFPLSTNRELQKLLALEGTRSPLGKRAISCFFDCGSSTFPHCVNNS